MVSTKKVSQINAEFAKHHVNARLTINDGVYVLRARGRNGYYLEDIYRPNDEDAMRFLTEVLAKCESTEEFFSTLA